MNFQWYPGHMAKTKRMINENISLVDVVIELLDARIPYSSKNPDIDYLARNKFRVIVLNKYDLADEKYTEKWKEYFKKKGFEVICTNSISGRGLSEVENVSRKLMKKKIDRLKEKGRIFVPIRAMIVGIPNVGKSTLINKCVGKAITKTEDRPGITKSKQWIKIKKDFELLDTPGILWPKFEDKKVGLNLALIGSINDEIVDIYNLSIKLIEILILENSNKLEERYNIKLNSDEDAYEILKKIGKSRGFKKQGGEIDLQRTAIIVVDEFRDCKLGRITLELPKLFS